LSLIDKNVPIMMYNAIQRYNNFLIYYYKNRTDKEIPTLRE